MDYLTIYCCVFIQLTGTHTHTSRSATYQYWGKRAPSVGESWLASVAAAAAPVAPDPKGPAEEAAVPPAEAVALDFVAELMVEGASSVGAQICH